MMEPTYFAQYRGFEFHCSPERLGDRAFAPRLVIHNAYDATSVEIPLESKMSPDADPTVAAHRAFALGRRWVDGGFQIPASAGAVEPSLLER